MHKLITSLKACFWAYRKEWLAGVVIVVLDQLSKSAVVLHLPKQYPLEIFPFFHLRYVENTGAAFGMMQDGNWLLIFVMAAIMIYIVKSWKELCSYGALVRWGCVFILAGAAGNLYDRITLGYVIDFLDFRVWPVFNVADSFITIGGGLFVLSLFTKRASRQEEK